jgi:hypothetical protein
MVVMGCVAARFSGTAVAGTGVAALLWLLQPAITTSKQPMANKIIFFPMARPSLNVV